MDMFLWYQQNFNSCSPWKKMSVVTRRPSGSNQPHSSLAPGNLWEVAPVAARWLSWMKAEGKKGDSKREGGRETAPDERGSKEIEGGPRGQAAPSGAFVLLAEGLSSSGSEWWHHSVKHGSGGRGHCCLLSPWQQVLSCSCASFTSGNKPLFYSPCLRSFTSSFSTFIKNNNLLMFFDSFLQSKPISFPHHFISTPSKHPFISSPLFSFPDSFFFIIPLSPSP